MIEVNFVSVLYARCPDLKLPLVQSNKGRFMRITTDFCIKESFIIHWEEVDMQGVEVAGIRAKTEEAKFHNHDNVHGRRGLYCMQKCWTKSISYRILLDTIMVTGRGRRISGGYRT